MSVADLRRLVQRATPRVEDVRSPDRTDFIRREHGHLSLREIVEALDALQFSFASFLRCFAELREPSTQESEGLEAEALVLSKGERLKRYCAAQPAVEMSSDTAVHQLHRLLKHVKTLESENKDVPATSTGPSSQNAEWAARTTDAPPNWQELVATEKARGGECFKQKDFQAAIAHYTTAIQASCLTPGDEAANEESKRELSSALSALFSNRCAARLQLDQGLEALSDARHCVELTPTWPKGHFREGCCLRQLNQLEDAQLAFATGQKLEPENKDWGKEMERTEKLLLAQPAYQVRQLLMQLLPDILAAWMRVAQPNQSAEHVLQLQVNGSFQQLSTCKWRQLQEGTQAAKAQIRYAILERKGYFANLVANLQSSNPEGFATTDLQGEPLSIADIKKFFDSSGKNVALHVDIKDDKDGKMKAILVSLPLDEGLQRFVGKAKDPDPPKAAIDSVLTIQRRSGFPKSYPRYLGFQMFPGDLNFPVIDLLRDAPAHAEK